MTRTRSGSSYLVLSVSLAIGGVGCANVTGGSGVAPRIRTIASVGDRTLPVVAGAPGDAVVAGREEPAPRPRPEGRISGRVYDDRGRPVPNAEVRLAVGGANRGRAVKAVTDESGAFTLHGLRRGTPYTIIAEREDGQGVLAGRAEVEAPDHDVRISLLAEDAPGRGRSGSPADEDVPGRVNRVSGRQEDEGAGEEGSAPREPRPRVNLEDLPPADEAEAVEPSESGSPPLHARPRAASPASGWRRGGPTEAARSSASSRPEPEDPPEEPAVAREERHVAPRTASDRDGTFEPASRRLPEERPPARPKAEDLPSTGTPSPADDPRPPAASVEPAPAATAGPPSPDSAPGLPPPDSSPPVDPPPPSPGPAAEVKPAKPIPAADTTLPDLADPSPAGASRRETPTAAPKNDPSPAVSLPTGPSAEGSPPATDAVGPASPAPPLDPAAAAAPAESGPEPVDPPSPAPASPPSADRRRPTWGELADRTPPKSAPAESSAPRTGLMSRLSKREPSPPPSRGETAACAFDARRQQLLDFRLPDIRGRSVRFKDLDADLVLLDFWGTWCGPCLQSVPHLAALQERFGPRKLKVVGIAYEEGPTADRVAAVEAAARKQGINYQLLLGGLDGPCPLQSALHVSAYPTLVLLDRDGHVLWRDQGSAVGTLARLDRVVASKIAPAPAVARR